ncbi:MAG: GntR family transcriptional regulator [Rhodospirillales bacterium]|jgi:DNA-binding GntR family transcriptional regulator|nr:GntR family transcriptional regulator [Rhodospirillales bacterium]
MADVEALIRPIQVDASLTNKAYDALKGAIASMNIYQDGAEQRLDERQLSEALGVSRTPIREALVRLEQEGLVRIVPRRGAFVVRKSQRQVVEMIVVWAALESMAARLVTENATDAEIASLRRMFATFENDQVEAKIDEYSETNIRFHQALLKMSGNDLIAQMTENLFIHMGAIRMRTIAEDNRASRSIIDHMNIIEALEARDTELAERLARQHTLDLAAHVEKNTRYLDRGPQQDP